MFGRAYPEDGTPRKVRKPCTFSTFEEDLEAPSQLSKKKSFLDCLQFIGAINRKESIRVEEPRTKKRGISHFCISSWDDEVQEGESDAMDEEPSEELNLKLGKKYTMIEKQGEEEIPDAGFRLYRNNSMFDADQRLSIGDEGKYGDNIYIEQIMDVEKRGTRRFSSKALPAYGEMDELEDEERLLKDYEVAKNIHGHVKHHQNLLCLNKLDRIFYYVKKIHFSSDSDPEQLQNLSNGQVRLYNKDDDGNLLRFYQSWTEDDCIYLIFETASSSLEDKLSNSCKMRESQAWNALKDACLCLEWMLAAEEYHLNIKPGNVLKCRDKFKLSDPLLSIENLAFFLNSFDKNEEMKLRQAYSYCAPEIITYRKLLTGLNLHKGDIYSLGLCVLENITSIPVTILLRELGQIRRNSEKYLKGYSPALRSLLMRMVNPNPSKRPDASQICYIDNTKPSEGSKEVVWRKLSL